MANLTTGATEVEPPITEPRVAGLFTAAEKRSISSDDRAAMGLFYESASCFPANFVDLDELTCMSYAIDEEDFDGFDFNEGKPFHIFAAVKCNPVAQSGDFGALASARLDYNSELLAERHLWEELLPSKAVDITPAGGPVSATLGLGELEEYAGQHYSGQPTIHAGKRATVSLAAKFVIEEAKTATGSALVSGAGYYSTKGPAGKVAPAGSVWLYATGRVLLLEAPIETYDAFHPESNDKLALAERTYVPAVDCFVAAILITLE